jgi:4'-phosphopantetheinyl transferase
MQKSSANLVTDATAVNRNGVAARIERGTINCQLSGRLSTYASKTAAVVLWSVAASGSRPRPETGALAKTVKDTQTFTAIANSDAPWQDRIDAPTLAPGEVHVWRVPLSASAAAVARARQLLDAEETARVALLAGAERKARQILSFGLLRLILAQYLHNEPKDVLFAKPKSGKPRLDGRSAASGLRFNVAHSEEMSLCAIAPHAEVGVDIERRRMPYDLESMLDAVLTPAERAIVRSLPSADRLQAFLDAWTLKEACLKATGEGIVGLAKVEAILGLTGRAPVLGIRVASADAPIPWTVWRLEPDAGYAAAVVVTAPCTGFRQFSIQPDLWLTCHNILPMSIL